MVKAMIKQLLHMLLFTQLLFFCIRATELPPTQEYQSADQQITALQPSVNLTHPDFAHGPTQRYVHLSLFKLLSSTIHTAEDARMLAQLKETIDHINHIGTPWNTEMYHAIHTVIKIYTSDKPAYLKRQAYESYLTMMHKKLLAHHKESESLSFSTDVINTFTSLLRYFFLRPVAHATPLFTPRRIILTAATLTVILSLYYGYKTKLAPLIQWVQNHQKQLRNFLADYVGALSEALIATIQRNAPLGSLVRTAVTTQATLPTYYQDDKAS